MALSPKQALGQTAEQQACDFLVAQGLRLVMKNYRCYHGEIDLIMQDKADFVFVEVRSRRRTDYGNAVESINKPKQRRLMRAALHFLQMKKCLYKVTSRFDIIAIHPIAGKMQLEWIKHAFSADSMR